MDIDVSFILTVHREGYLLPRTIRSIREAAAYSAAQGLRIQLIVTLDRPDDLTRDLMAREPLQIFEDVKIVEVDHGSPGLSRNTAATYACGKYILLCDGDDLISFNFISSLFFEAERSKEKTIIIPEWVLDFGVHYSTAQLFDLRFATPLSFIDSHPYISKILFRRELMDTLQFEDVQVTPGYAYEDWHFNAEAVALGYDFRVATDAILFYRIRKSSQLRESDRISVRQIPASKLFEPKTFVKLCADAVAQMRLGEFRAPKISGTDRLYDPSAHLLIAAANRIDPGVEPSYMHNGSTWNSLKSSNLAIGLAYFEICCQLGDEKFDHIVLVPNFGVGGAERYFLNIVNAILETRPHESILVLIGEPHRDNEWLGKISPSIHCIDLAKYLPSVGEYGIDLITLKLIQSCGKDSVLHFRQANYTQRFFDKFGRALTDNKSIFYCFCEDIRPRGEFGLVQPWSFSFISSHFDFLESIVADNDYFGRAHQSRMGVTSEKWKVLPTLVDAPISREEAVARAQQPSSRILWASRLSWQKRPELIIAIARKLHQVRPDLTIDVYGGHAMEFDAERLRGMPNVVCHGAYSDFSAIAEKGFICLIYTSFFDGVPTVVLEAAASGLPIIAPDVPAIDEFMIDGVTGRFLPSFLDDEAMADAYVDAIVEISDDPSFASRLAGAAYDRLGAIHGRAPYMRAFEHVLELSGGGAGAGSGPRSDSDFNLETPFLAIPFNE